MAWIFYAVVNDVNVNNVNNVGLDVGLTGLTSDINSYILVDGSGEGLLEEHL